MEGGLGLLLICAVWILVRPYQGVRHDAILYLGQALHRLWPDVLSRDIFFSHGSQDQFTLIAAPLAWLLSHLGVANGEMALTAACNLGFVAAAWTLCGMLDPARRWICTLSVVLLSHAYARLEDFNYAENFFTARSVAEPLVLLALVAWVQRRDVRASVLFAVAALIHPLVVIPALVVAWGIRVAADRRWLWGLAVGVPIIALAWTGVAPFAGLFERFDDTWWELIRQSCGQVLMASWDAVDRVSAGLDLMLLGIACAVLKPTGRPLIKSVLVSSALLLLVAFIGGDVVRDVLIVQLQLWRVLWLSHLLAMLCVPAVVLEFWQEGGAGRIVGAAAAAAVLTVSWTLPHAWIFVLWLPMSLVIRRRANDVSNSLVRVALGGTVLAIAVTSVVLAVTTYRLVEGDPVLSAVVHPVLAMLAIPSLGVLAAVAVAGLLRRLPSRAAATLLVALVAICIPQWDQRSDWNRTVEASTFEEHPFDRFIPRLAQVYWHTELLPTWAMLHRASYVSIGQGSGTVFNRATAQAYAERNLPMQALITHQIACQMAANAAGLDVECQPAQPLVEAFCALPRGPDFVVFDARYSRGLVAQWDYRVGHGTAPRTAFLYDCSQMRRGSAGPR